MKLTDLATQMQSEAMRRVKSATVEKGQVEQLRRELGQSQEYLYSAVSEVKKDYQPYADLHNSLSSSKFRPFVNYPEERVPGVMSPIAARSRGISSTDSVTDSFSVVYHGFYPSHGKTECTPSIMHVKNSKAKAPKRKQSYPPTSSAVSLESDEVE